MRAVPDEGYPFPIHDGPPIDVSDDQAIAYERTLCQLLSEWIEQEAGEAHGHSGVLLKVSLAGRRPHSKLILGYRSHAGGEYGAEVPIWGEENVIAPATEDQPPTYEAPADLIGVVVSNWLDGSIRADDDPFWVALERQRSESLRRNSELRNFND